MTDQVSRRGGSLAEFRSAVVRVLLVVGAGLVLGGATSWLQLALPEPLRPFANSIGGWAMLTFVIVWLAGARPVLSAILGVLAFQALNEGYGVMSLWRGFFYAAPFSSSWTYVGIPAGLVFGALASLVRFGPAGVRVVSTSVLSALLAADGLWSAVTVGATTGYTWWIIELVLAVGFLVLAAVRSRPAWWAYAASLGVMAAAIAAYPVATAMLL